MRERHDMADPITIRYGAGEYDKLKTAAATIKAANYHLEQLTYGARIEMLDSVETMAEAIRALADMGLRGQSNCPLTVASCRTVMRGIIKANPVMLKAAPCGGYLIEAPVLGNRRGSNYKIVELLRVAISAAADRGVQIKPNQNGVVIVKQFGDIDRMKLCTLENREVHILVDKMMQEMHTQDKPRYFDTVYIWCASPDPHTEIVITTRGQVGTYNDYVHELDEWGTGDANARYAAHRNARARLKRAANALESYLEGHPDYASNETTQTQSARNLVRLFGVLANLMVILRAPGISDGERNTQQYGKGKSPTEEDYAAYRQTATLLGRVDYHHRTTGERYNLYCDPPRTCYRRTSKMQSDMVESALVDATRMNWYAEVNRLSPDYPDGGPLAFEIIRDIAPNNTKACDADNVNVAFCRRWGSRVRIIRSALRSGERWEYGAQAMVSVMDAKCFRLG